MFKNKYPLFVKKHILKIEMLENIRDYPRDLVRIKYQNYCDGILHGCRIEMRGDELWLKSGVVLYAGKTYLMGTDMQIEYNADGVLNYLKLKFMGEIEDADMISHQAEVVLDDKEPSRENEIELARFKLQQGARLRSEHTGFRDYNTEFDTVNLLYAPYSSEDGERLCPKVLKTFAQEMLKRELRNAYDLPFCMICMNAGGDISRTLLVCYLQRRCRKQRKYDTTIEMYKGLLELLDQDDKDEPCEPQSGPRPRRIILM